MPDLSLQMRFNIFYILHWLNFTFEIFLQLEFDNWKKTEETRCSNNSNSEYVIENLAECKSMCLQNNNCVGVSFSTYWAIHATSWCYLCNDYNTTAVGYYDFYQRPGNVNWYLIQKINDIFKHHHSI